MPAPLVLRRILGAACLLWLVLTLTFGLLRLAPGDPAAFLVAPTASADEEARMRRSLGLDRPIAVQYARWSASLLRGDLGTSFAQRRPVTELVAEALPISLGLGGASLALSILVGVPLGILQAARRGRPFDRVASAVTVTALAAPSYWLALALVAVFTYGASRWGFPAWLRLPAFGVRTPGAEATGWAAVVDVVRHAVLPVAILALVGAAGVARYARSSVSEVLSRDFIRTARAKGAGEARVLGRHALANALAPLVVLVALMLPGVVAGSVFVESVFAWPGMGRLMLTAIASRDFPVVLGVTALYAGIVIAANLLADLVLLAIDPRRRTT